MPPPWETDAMDFTFRLYHGKVENKQKESMPGSPTVTL